MRHILRQLFELNKAHKKIEIRALALLLLMLCDLSGPKYEYHWADGQTVKRPIKCSAPKYIDYLMTWAQDQLDDESLFPSKIGENQHLFTSF